MRRFQRKLSGKSERDEGENGWPCLWILLLNVAWESTRQLWCREHSVHTRSPAGLGSSHVPGFDGCNPPEIPKAG